MNTATYVIPLSMVKNIDRDIDPVKVFETMHAQCAQHYADVQENRMIELHRKLDEAIYELNAYMQRCRTQQAYFDVCVAFIAELERKLISCE